MLTVIAALLGGLLVVAVCALSMLRNISVNLRTAMRTLEDVRRSVWDIRMRHRSRIASASLRDAPRDDLDDLKGLARASAGRRVVFGGDPATEQHRHLSRPMSDRLRLRPVENVELPQPDPSSLEDLGR